MVWVPENITGKSSPVTLPTQGCGPPAQQRRPPSPVAKPPTGSSTFLPSLSRSTPISPSSPLSSPSLIVQGENEEEQAEKKEEKMKEKKKKKGKKKKKNKIRCCLQGHARY
jgi:hypothetical protein